MSDRFDQLSAKHVRLRTHAALQRRALGERAQEIEQRLTGVDRAVVIARNVVRQPALLIGGVAIIALVGPRRLLRWAGRSALWITTARKVMRLVQSR